MINNSFDEFYEIEAVIPSLQMEYGLDLDIYTVKELGYKLLKQIGNIYQTVYLYVGTPVNGELKLPCKVANILAVTDNLTFDYTGFPRRKDMELYNLQSANELHITGQYIDYRFEDGVIKLYRNNDRNDYNSTVYVLYGSQLVDEKDFPKITYFEKEAIAAWCYFIETKKKVAMGLMNGNLLQLAQKDYKQKVDQARIPQKLTNNLIDKLLNIRLGYNMKVYGKRSGF